MDYLQHARGDFGEGGSSQPTQEWMAGTHLPSEPFSFALFMGNMEVSIDFFKNLWCSLHFYEYYGYLLQDSKKNRIAQWQNFRLEGGLKQLSFPLSSEPTQGSYKVVIRTESGRTVEHPFSVKEFGTDCVNIVFHSWDL